MDVAALIATALAVETQAVLAHLRDAEQHSHPSGAVYWVGSANTGGKKISLAVVRTGAGNVPAALEVQRAIEHFSPRAVVFVGIGGGLKDVRIGDVVAADRVVGYETGKEAVEFLARGDALPCNYKLVQQAHAAVVNGSWAAHLSEIGSGTEPPSAFVGTIVAGEKVLTSTDGPTYQMIRRTYSEALAVEMEAIGTMRAVHATGSVPAIVVRGISDLCGGKEHADAGGSQPRAAANAATFAFEIIGGWLRAGAKPDLNQWVEIARDLYPEGPKDSRVWKRAGGDLSRLNLSQDARSVWYDALDLALKGGGGEGFVDRLIQVMRTDFADDERLKAL